MKRKEKREKRKEKKRKRGTADLSFRMLANGSEDDGKKFFTFTENYT